MVPFRQNVKKNKLNNISQVVAACTVAHWIHGNLDYLFIGPKALWELYYQKLENDYSQKTSNNNNTISYKIHEY